MIVVPAMPCQPIRGCARSIRPLDLVPQVHALCVQKDGLEHTMKMKIMTLACVCILATGCVRHAHRMSYGCTRGDMTAAMSKDEITVSSAFGEAWMKDVVACRVGDLWFVVLTDQTNTAYR